MQRAPSVGPSGNPRRTSSTVNKTSNLKATPIPTSGRTSSIPSRQQQQTPSSAVPRIVGGNTSSQQQQRSSSSSLLKQATTYEEYMALHKKSKVPLNPNAYNEEESEEMCYKARGTAPPQRESSTLPRDIKTPPPSFNSSSSGANGRPDRTSLSASRVGNGRTSNQSTNSSAAAADAISSNNKQFTSSNAFGKKGVESRTSEQISHSPPPVKAPLSRHVVAMKMIFGNLISVHASRANSTPSLCGSSVCHLSVRPIEHKPDVLASETIGMTPSFAQNRSCVADEFDGDDIELLSAFFIIPQQQTAALAVKHQHSTIIPAFFKRNIQQNLWRTLHDLVFHFVRVKANQEESESAQHPHLKATYWADKDAKAEKLHQMRQRELRQLQFGDRRNCGNEEASMPSNIFILNPTEWYFVIKCLAESNYPRIGDLSCPIANTNALQGIPVSDEIPPPHLIYPTIEACAEVTVAILWLLLFGIGGCGQRWWFETFASQNASPLTSFVDLLKMREENNDDDAPETSLLQGVTLWPPAGPMLTQSVLTRISQLSKVLQVPNTSSMPSPINPDGPNHHALATLLRSSNILLDKLDILLQRRADIVGMMKSHNPSDYAICAERNEFTKDETVSSFYRFEGKLSQARASIEEELQFLRLMIPDERQKAPTSSPPFNSPPSQYRSSIPCSWERYLLESIRFAGNFTGTSLRSKNQINKNHLSSVSAPPTLTATLSHQLHRLQHATHNSWNHLLRMRNSMHISNRDTSIDPRSKPTGGLSSSDVKALQHCLGEKLESLKSIQRNEVSPPAKTPAVGSLLRTIQSEDGSSNTQLRMFGSHAARQLNSVDITNSTVGNQLECLKPQRETIHSKCRTTQHKSQMVLINPATSAVRAKKLTCAEMEINRLGHVCSGRNPSAQMPKSSSEFQLIKMKRGKAS